MVRGVLASRNERGFGDRREPRARDRLGLVCGVLASDASRGPAERKLCRRTGGTTFGSAA
jgi:hypothetical protein